MTTSSTCLIKYAEAVSTKFLRVFLLSINKTLAINDVNKTNPMLVSYRHTKATFSFTPVKSATTSFLQCILTGSDYLHCDMSQLTHVCNLL